MPKLNVEVGVDGTRLVRGLKGTESAVAQWSNSVKGYVAAAFSVTAIAAAMNQTAGYFDNIGNAAERLDIGAAAMQTLLRMAQLAGKELGNVEQMMNSIADAQIAAIENPESAQGKAFARMGLTPEILNALNPDELTQVMARSNQGLTTGEQRQNLTDIVGKKNVGMFTAMMDDLANLQQTTKRLIDEGIIPSDQAVVQFNQKLDLFSQRWNDFKHKIMGITELFVDFGNALMAPFEMDWSKNKGKGWEGFQDDMAELFTKMFSLDKVDPELQKLYNRKTAADVKGLVEPRGPGIEIGSGVKPKTDTEKKDEPKRTDWMRGFEKYTPEPFRGPQLPMSNFLGSNLGLIQNASVETQNILRKIEKNTKEMATRSAMQTTSDLLYQLFGVTY